MQDMRSPGLAPEINTNPALLQSYGCPTVSRRVCRSMEGRTPGARGCSQSPQGICDKQPRPDYKGETPAVFQRAYFDWLSLIIQRFCKEVVTWKALHHQNVLPLLGVTMGDGHFAMVSEWMINGNIKEFVEAHRDVNRFELVGFSSCCWPHP